MKTKEKEIQKKIKELHELMDEDDKFFFFRKKGNAVVIALPSASEENDNRVSAALASVIEAHFLDKGNEGVDRLSEIIVDSIEAFIGVSPLAGAKLTARFAKAALIGMKKPKLQILFVIWLSEIKHYIILNIPQIDNLYKF